MITAIPFYLLLSVIAWNGLAVGGGWYGEKLLYRHRHRIAHAVLQEPRLPWSWRERIVKAIYWLYPLHNSSEGRHTERLSIGRNERSS